MTEILDTIQSPADIKALPDNQLPLLAREVRERLIETCSQTGGHIGPNLGVVELTIALHRVFSTPTDKFVFDVAHQGYVHKMFTGRLDRIGTIRQYQGLSGFLTREESEHDCYGAGHAGTAVSSALGMAAARDLNGTDENIVVVAGDAAFTCGVTFEALNNVSETTKRFIVILNDNEWSIARNVGAIARHLHGIVTSDQFEHLRERAKGFLQWVGGKGAVEFATRFEESVKHLLWPSVLFEHLGLKYYGPIDGHDLPALTRTLDFLKHQDQPVLLHAITQKGRGFEPALARPDKFHGLSAFDSTTGKTQPATQPTYSEIFGETLSKFADEDEKLTAITAAMPGGTKLEIFEKRHPKRFFDVGIAEEHAALFAAGQATQGLKPFLAIYSTFMQRAYDMLIHDITLQNLPVRLCMDRGGLSGDDGPTHHGLFDIGYLRHIPNIIHLQPKDEAEFVHMLWTMLHYNDGPIAIRYPRGAGMGASLPEKPELLEIGKAEMIRDGEDVALIGLGAMFELAQEAARRLEEQGFSVALVNPRWIKPLDTDLLNYLARSVRVICTLEDHVLHNGFGCAVMEHLYSQGLRTPVERIGWPDAYVEHGKVSILRKKHGLTVEAALEKVAQHLNLSREQRAALISGATIPSPLPAETARLSA